mgnify:FL=1
MIGYNYLSKYNDWHDDFIISWHDKRIFLFEISKASDPTHARQGYNCRELEIVNDNNILMQTSFNCNNIFKQLNIFCKKNPTFP